MGSSWDFLSAPVPTIGLLPPLQLAVAQDAHPPESAPCEPAVQRQQCVAGERSAGTTLPGADAVAPAQAVETRPQQNHGVPLVHHETVVDEGRAQLLLMLHPSSPATITEVLNHSSCPSWVAGALRAIISSLSGGGRAPSAPIAKQRLALAATIALEVTDLMESRTDRAIMQQLGFSPRRLLNDLAGAQVRLGSGLNSGALKVTCKKLGITAPADTEHYSRIDGAYRILLAQLWLGDARSMLLVRRICERLQQQLMLPLSEEVIPFPAEADLSHPRYVSVAGDGHCLYSCISRAEGVTNPDVRDAIRAELESQPSEMPGCLPNINLVDKPEHCIHIVDAETAHAAKQQSLQSRRLNNMWFAGESELLLYAKSTQGAVRFRALSSSDYNGDGWAKNPRIQVWRVDGSQPTREIVLHLCTYNGREGTGLQDTREPAHYNLIMAELADGSTCGHWPIDRSMGGDQAARAATDLRLWQICKASVVQNASRWETKCREEEVKSLQLAHTLQQSAGSAFLKPIPFRSLAGSRAFARPNPNPDLNPPADPLPTTSVVEAGRLDPEVLEPAQPLQDEANAAASSETNLEQPTHVPPTSPPSPAPRSHSAAGVSGVIQAFAPASPPRRSASVTRSGGSGGRRSSMASPSRPRSRLTSPVRRLTFAEAAVPAVERVAAPTDASLPIAASSAPPARKQLSEDWRQNRSAVLADLDSSTLPAFISAMTVMFEAYRTHSTTSDWSSCARILRILLDFPALAMRLGSSKQRQVYFQQAHEAAREMLHVITMTPEAQPDAASIPQPSARMDDFNTVLVESDAHPTVTEFVGEPAVVPCLTPVGLAEEEKANSPTVPLSVIRQVAIDVQRLRNVRRARTILRHRGPHALSRAAKALQSLPRAPINATTLAALRALHPQAVSPMGSLPAHHAAQLISVEKVLDRAVKRCNNGSAPGISGWTGAHLAAIVNGCTKEAVQGFHLLIRDICNGIFTGELHRRLQACCLTPLTKKTSGIRPIAIMEVFSKCAAHCAVLLIEDRIPSLFPTIQYGVKRSGGSETAAHLMRCLLRRCSQASPHQAAALELDFENAFNTVSRKRVWDTLLQHAHATGPMLKAFYVQYSEASPLLVYDGDQFVEELSSTEGVRQGDPFAALAFALMVQPLYEAAIATIEPSGGRGVAIQDDLAAVATWREVLKVFDYVHAHAHEYGLKLRVDKCELYLPPDTARGHGCTERLEEIRSACNERQIPITFKSESLGVMHGDDKDIEQFCEDVVDENEEFFQALEHSEMGTQASALLLRYCAIPRSGVSLTYHPPGSSALSGASIR